MARFTEHLTQLQAKKQTKPKPAQKIGSKDMINVYPKTPVE